ncbi:MAG TPA: flagellar motor switch protein FliG [Syntrophales bacterium]|nr:flagellar motor switch protein FliG [Syntrophales bacterium]
MNNEEKAAILLLSLNEEQAAEVMKNLRSSEVRRISKYMSRITSISSKDVQVVAKEFCDLAKEKGGIQSVKEDVAKNIVMRALGPEQAGSIITALDDEKEKFNENPIFEKLRDIDPKLLTDFTKMEHPQTIALILAHLRPEQAAEIMDSLGPEMQIEIVRRMSSLKSVPMELIEDVAQTLEDEIITGASNEKEVGGVKLMADILNRMNRTSESAIISSLDSSDPELAAEIRGLMFTFDDILKLDDRSMQELLREVASEDLSKALKVIDAEGREKVFKNMSKRGADMLKEDIDMMPPIRLSDVEKSQRAILDICKRLEAEGRIQLSREGGDEFV